MSWRYERSVPVSSRNSSSAAGVLPTTKLVRHQRTTLGAVAMALASWNVPVALAAEPVDAALVQRGQYLATAGDCIACHTAPGGKPFAGGQSLQTPLGAVMATNITPSKTYGIGNYTFEQFTAALRKGLRADGAHLYPAMPYPSYSQVTDDDVKALYAYFMNGVAPIDTPSPRVKLPFPFNIRLSMAVWNLLFLNGRPFEPDPGKSAEWNRGAYLVRGLTHCGACHTPRNVLMAEEVSRELDGADLGTWYAPNITSDVNSGVGGWSEDELIDYLRGGNAANKAQAAGPMAEAVDHSLRHMDDNDLRSIPVYLKSVPPLHNDADTRPAFQWGAAGNDLGKVRGVPWPADPNQISGPQLYDAYCATCHQSDGEGRGNGGLPSLFHNTTLGRANTDNLVMVLLDGVQRQPDTPALLMPGFRSELSDQQVATLSAYLIQRYGNPKAEVTLDQVRELRAGGKGTSWLIAAARVGIAAAATLVVLLAVLVAVRPWRPRATS